MHMREGSRVGRVIGSFLPAVTVVILLVVAGIVLRRSGADESDDGLVLDPSTFVPNGLLTSQRRVQDSGNWPAHFEGIGETWVRTYRSDVLSAVEVVQDGRRLMAFEDHRIVILDEVPDSATVEASLLGDNDRSRQERGDDGVPWLDTDVTGDGVPDVVLATWSGGAHCCFGMIVCEFAPKFRVHTIQFDDDGAAEWIQADQDPAFEINTRDWTFAYWETSFGESPAPAMILKYDGSDWKPCAALMRQPAPADLGAADLAVRWKRFVGQLPPDQKHFIAPWGPLLDLIYTGNAPQAWQVLDAAWPGDETGKREFRHKLLDQMRKSPAWPALVEMNGAALTD